MDSLINPQDIPSVLNSAVSDHQSGNLEGALNKYLEILKVSPNHPDALHMAGLVYYQAGQNQLAIEYINKAISVSPKQASYYGNLGLAYAAQNQYEDAISTYKKAISLNNNYPEALFNLGNAFRNLEKPKAAIKYYKQAIKSKADYAQAYNNLGTALNDLGKKAEAITNLKKAIQLSPSLEEAKQNLQQIEQPDNELIPKTEYGDLDDKSSNLLQNTIKHAKDKKFDQALQSVEKLIELNPANAEIKYLCAMIYLDIQDYDKGIDLINQAVEIKPENPKYINGLGVAMVDKAGKISSIDDLANATKLETKAHAINGASYNNCTSFVEAEKAYHQALSMDPNNHITYHYLGSIQKNLEKYDSAVENLTKALEINPQHYKSHLVLGTVYSNLGNFSDARNHYNAALEQNPEYYEAILNRSYSYILEGNFENGWSDYEARLKLGKRAAEKIDALNKLKLLDPSNSSNKSPILLLPEQGVGDEVMYAGLINDFAKQYSENITLLCDIRLVELYRRSFPKYNIAALDKFEIAPNSQKAFVGSLPKLLNKNKLDDTADAAYLTANPKKIEHFQNKYSKITTPKIGISWKSGNPLEGPKRSLPLVNFKEIVSNINATFFNLQYGDHKQEINDLKHLCGIEVINDNEIDPLNNLDDFAAFISSLDLVITVDNSTAHFAGALGVETMVMLPFSCDWRWMKSGSSSIWYNSLKLFRQIKIGDWTNVLEEVYSDLISHFKSQSSSQEEIYNQLANNKISENKVIKAAKSDHQQGKLQSALDKYLAVNRFSPKNHEVKQLAGLAYYQTGHNEQAIEFIENAIKIDSNQANYYGNLGLAYAAEKNMDKAIYCYEKALSLNSNYPEALYNLGNAHQNNGNTESAIDCYQKALKIKPNYFPALNNLGTSLQKLGKLEEAAIEFNKAIKLNPHDFSIYNNLGAIASDLNKPNEATTHFEKALNIIRNCNDIKQDKHIEILHNAALAYIDTGDFNKALAKLNTALEISGSLAPIHFSKFIALFSSGNIGSSWSEYDYRPKKEGITEKYNHILQDIAVWNPESVNDCKELILLPEQGIGDEVMFAGIIQQVCESFKGDITLACDERLIDIYQRSFTNVSVTSLSQLKPKDSSYKLHIGDLTKHFCKTIYDFKPVGSYLSADESLIEHFSDKYSELKGLKIGIAWKSGNPQQGKCRSIPLESWKDIFATPECHFFDLQYGDNKEEIDEFISLTGNTLIHDSEVNQLEELENFIALISNLDLVITIDNSTAHIAGALGIPTWVMLPFACDWRWMRKRPDSIWYKSLRLYRQSSIGNWEDVIKEISNDLKNNKLDNAEYINTKEQANNTVNSDNETKKQTNNNNKTIAFLNDTTAWYHWGCTATSSAIRKRLLQSGYKTLNVPILFTYNFKSIPKDAAEFDSPDFFNSAVQQHNDLFQAINQCEQVVINGEGSIHHLSNVSLSILYMAYASKKFLGKPVHIINHSPYPDNVREARDDYAFQLYRSIYNQLDYIAIREHISHKLMTDYGTKAELSFDCLPITVTEDYKPEILDKERNIVISGSVSFKQDRMKDLEKLMTHFSQKGYKIKILHGAKDLPAQDDQIFIQELQKVHFKKYEIVNANSLTQWLDCINSASVFVSGRFHHSLAAIYLETPCVMMESNTFKNVAIAETFNMPDPIQFSSDSFFEELLTRTEIAVSSEPVDAELRKQMLARSEVNFMKIKELS